MPKSFTDKRHFLIVAALIAISTVFLNWLLNTALPLPVQASLESLTIDRLIGWHLFMIAFLFSVIVVFMLYSFVVFRKRKGDEHEGQHFEGNYILEIAWTVIPLIFVVVFAIIGVVTLDRVTHATPDELIVKVTGFQWAWSFEYPDGVVSAEMVLPVDQRVHLEMRSNDVIHSFWVPQFRVKQDLLPGQVTDLRFTPIEVGEYKVRCAELCGLSHWSMEAPVRVLSQADYDQWLQEKTAGIDSAITEAKK